MMRPGVMAAWALTPLDIITPLSSAQGRPEPCRRGTQHRGDAQTADAASPNPLARRFAPPEVEACPARSSWRRDMPTSLVPAPRHAAYAPPGRSWRLRPGTVLGWRRDWRAYGWYRRSASAAGRPHGPAPRQPR